jgi:hypothetical protein
MSALRKAPPISIVIALLPSDAVMAAAAGIDEVIAVGDDNFKIILLIKILIRGR